MTNVADPIISAAASAFRELAEVAVQIADDLERLRDTPSGGDDPVTGQQAKVKAAAALIYQGADRLHKQMAIAGEAIKRGVRKHG